MPGLLEKGRCIAALLRRLHTRPQQLFAPKCFVSFCFIFICFDSKAFARKQTVRSVRVSKKFELRGESRQGRRKQFAKKILPSLSPATYTSCNGGVRTSKDRVDARNGQHEARAYLYLWNNYTAGEVVCYTVSTRHNEFALWVISLYLMSFVVPTAVH